MATKKKAVKVPKHTLDISDKSAVKLEELAKMVKKIPEEHFDMNFWAAKEINGNTNGHVLVCKKEMNVCGTVGCIAGHYLLQKRMCIRDSKVYKSFSAYERGEPALGDASDVAQRLLGLTENQASKLFIPWRSGWYDFDKTPSGAALRIRHFIKTGE